MDKIIKIPVDAGKVTISEDTKSILRNLFSGCRVNFLFGAGFSANLLGTLSNNEVIFEALQNTKRKMRMKGKKLRYYPLFCIGRFSLDVLNRFLRYRHMIPHLIHIKISEILYTEFFLKEAIRR